VTNREKFIVSMAVAALLYGLYNTFSKPVGQDAPGDNEPDAAVLLAKEALRDKPADSEAITRIIVNAQRSWRNDAFLVAGLDQEGGVPENVQDIPTEAKGIVYSGYLEMAGERIAIINKSEYRVGDHVKIFTVEEITPYAVRLSLHGKDFEINFQEMK